jgi:hypothetical protein
MAGSRVDNWLVSVTVGGRNLGTFDGSTGGKLVGQSTKWRDGGMGPQSSHGGPPEREDMTCTRRYDFDRDHPIIGFLESMVGKADQASISRQPLDPEGIPYGRPRTYSGTLNGVDSPETDSNDAAIGVLTLEFELNQAAA